MVRVSLPRYLGTEYAARWIHINMYPHYIIGAIEKFSPAMMGNFMGKAKKTGA